MADSDKSSEKKSIFSRIASSINEINEIDVDESKDRIDIDELKNQIDVDESKDGIDVDELKDEIEREYKEKSEEKYLDGPLPLTSKVGEFLSNDFKKKFSLLAIGGGLIGIVLIIFGISLLLGNSEKVVDHVAFGETGSSSIFVIILGVLILGLSLFKIFVKKRAYI